MDDVLRLLAIHIAEPDAGRFEWVITEQMNGDWKQIGRAQDGYETYKAAMASGLVALQQMISDLDVGPRCGVEEIDASQDHPEIQVHPAPPDAGVDDLVSKKKPKKAAYFGFGPIR